MTVGNRTRDSQTRAQ